MPGYGIATTCSALIRPANNSLARSANTSREAAIRDSDGTEKPSPPGESRSLMRSKLNETISGCQLKRTNLVDKGECSLCRSRIENQHQGQRQRTGASALRTLGAEEGPGFEVDFVAVAVRPFCGASGTEHEHVAFGFENDAGGKDVPDIFGDHIGGEEVDGAGSVARAVVVGVKAQSIRCRGGSWST
jgi:hypothetical protein